MNIPKIAMITNPHSGYNKRKGTASIRSLAEASNITYHEPSSLNELEPLLRALSAEHIDILIVNGGDGTFDSIITLIRNHAIFKKEPAFMLLHGGTTNMTHQTVGTPGNPEKALRKIIHAVKHGRLSYHSQHPLKIHWEDSATHYGFFFGAIAIPRLICHTREVMHSKGLTGGVGEAITFINIIIRLLCNRASHTPLLAPVTTKLTDSNGQCSEKTCIFLISTTLPTLLLGISPFSRKGHMSILSLEQPYQRLWKNLWALLRGKKSLNQKGLYSDTDTSLSCVMESDWTIDGELFTGKKDQRVQLDVTDPITYVKVS